MPASHQTGASAVEFVIALPVLLLLILSSLQAALLYQARLQLEVAAQEAARAGTLHGGNVNAMRDALTRGLVPLYTDEQSLSDRAQAEAAARLAHLGKPQPMEGDQTPENMTPLPPEDLPEFPTNDEPPPSYGGSSTRPDSGNGSDDHLKNSNPFGLGQP